MGNSELRKDIMSDLMRLAEENKFSGLEKVKKIHLIVDPFTIENDILTPKMSIKRHVAKKVFEAQIKAMYDEPLWELLYYLMIFK